MSSYAIIFIEMKSDYLNRKKIKVP